MLSRQTARERKKNRSWMCLAWMQLDGDGDIEREDHSCTLEKLHFGPHLCWCGWRFWNETASWHQPRLPLG